MYKKLDFCTNFFNVRQQCHLLMIFNKLTVADRNNYGRWLNFSELKLCFWEFRPLHSSSFCFICKKWNIQKTSIFHPLGANRRVVQKRISFLESHFFRPFPHFEQHRPWIQNFSPNVITPSIHPCWQLKNHLTKFPHLFWQIYTGLDFIHSSNVNRLNQVFKSFDLLAKLLHGHLCILNDAHCLKFLNAVTNFN